MFVVKERQKFLIVSVAEFLNFELVKQVIALLGIACSVRSLIFVHRQYSFLLYVLFLELVVCLIWRRYKNQAASVIFEVILYLDDRTRTDKLFACFRFKHSGFTDLDYCDWLGSKEDHKFVSVMKSSFFQSVVFQAMWIACLLLWIFCMLILAYL